jgi:hypothetical protein
MADKDGADGGRVVREADGRRSREERSRDDRR